jgi:LysR family hydrogen peroxide-inducible transcriptional activator
MNLQQVRYFLAVCKQRNFTRAAESCEVRQPSLTSAIQRLEREIGGDLFVRSVPIQLSPLGKELRPLFVRMHQAAERAHHIAAQRKRSPRRVPSFGTSVSLEPRV